MIESIIDELRRSQNDENNPPDLIEKRFCQENSENAFLAALPVVQKIVRRRLVFSGHRDASDLEQGIILRLWDWREKYGEKSEQMSPDEWSAFAARAAHNEINRYFSGGMPASVPLDAASLLASEQSVAGESKIEVYLLVNFVWQRICCLSLRQRRALLLHSRKLVVYFLQSGICDTELTQVLEFTEIEWLEIKNRLPLPDASIARLIQKQDKNRSLESITESIKKARYEARAKLKKLTGNERL